MSLFQAVVLGILQGLTEFLPISSSAHLALAPWLFGWPDQGLAFDIALHIGTLGAVILYFFRDWVQVIAQGFGFRLGSDPQLERQPRLLWLMAAGSIPVAIAGLSLKTTVETTFRNPILMASMLILVAFVMAWADRTARLQKDIGQVSLADALTIGMAQAVALVPGTSRSGITIVAGLVRRLDRHAAARFSFLLSAPAIFGAVAKDAYDLFNAGGIPEDLRLAFAIGILTSGITGCLAIGLLLKFLRRHGLMFFVYYRVAFGIIVIALALFRGYRG